MTDTTEFPNRLRKLLAMNNMSQAQLCRLTGINRATLSRYLAGQRHATDSNMYLISKALNVNIAWLMGYNSEEMENAIPKNPGMKTEIYELVDTMDDKQLETTLKFIKSFVLPK